MAPPPICQALFLSFQVSLPGSPGAGMTYLRQISLPEAPSSAAIQSRTPRSPPVARRGREAHPAVTAGRAHDNLVLDRERRRGDLHVGLIVQIRLPDDLAGV